MKKDNMNEIKFYVRKISNSEYQRKKNKVVNDILINVYGKKIVNKYINDNIPKI